jgi:6-phosphofructokinase 2
MPTIVTITANPCIDKSTTFSGLKPDKKLRCSNPKFEPGGGGINVSRAIHKLNGKSLAIYPAGGYSGIFLKELLQKDNIDSIVINTKEHTRENFIVVDEATNNQYRFCMPGPVLLENEWQELLHKIEPIKDAEYIVASGSLPRGVPENFFARIAAIAKDKQAKLILDTSGAPLKHALEKGVYLWKPNLGELSSLSECDELNEETALVAAKKIIAKGMAEVIVISLGAAGAMLVTKDICDRYITPVVPRKSTVGAGDSMVAGIVLSLSKGATLSEAVNYGIACGTAATMNIGTELCRPEDVEKLYKSLSVTV